MPLYLDLRKYLKAQEVIVMSGGFDDDPETDYLLGFDVEKLQPLPAKTYIRRLWLAFQSGKSLTPKYFFDVGAEEFSKEIDHWVSVFANDSRKLVAELAKEPIDVGNVRRSTFLKDAAQTLLVTRKWGETLWGESQKCRTALGNAKHEPGYDRPPRWTEDEQMITLTVRQWMATRIQDRVRNPREKKHVPRVSCPEDPEERRESIAAVFPDLIREDSEEEAMEPEEAEEVEEVERAILEEQANAANPSLAVRLQVEPPPTLAADRHSPVLPPRYPRRRTRANGDPLPALLNGGGDSHASRTTANTRSGLEPGMSQSRSIGSTLTDPTTVLAQGANARSRSSSKRKRDEGESSIKRTKVSRGNNTSSSRNVDYSERIGPTLRRRNPSGPTPLHDAILRRRNETAGPALTRQAKAALDAESRSLETRSEQQREERADLQATAVIDPTLTPTPQRSIALHPDPSSPSHSIDLVGGDETEPEHQALYHSTPPVQLIGKANLRSASRRKDAAENATTGKSLQTSAPSVGSQLEIANGHLQPGNLVAIAGDPDEPNDQPREAADAGPVCTIPDQDLDLYQRGTPSVDDQISSLEEPRVDSASSLSGLDSRQPDTIIPVCQTSSTKAPSQEQWDEDTSAENHDQADTQTETSITPPLKPAYHMANEQPSPVDDQNTSPTLESASGPVWGRTQDSGPDHNVEPESTPSTSQRDSHTPKNTNQDLCSPQTAHPPENLPFPPSTSSTPPRCNRCHHSLDRTIDVMKDLKGFAQWKTKCIYCRGRGGVRPALCQCHTCVPQSAEQDVHMVSPGAATSMQEVDALLLEQLATPFAEQPVSPSTEQSDTGHLGQTGTPYDEGSALPVSKTTSQKRYVENTGSSIETVTAHHNNRIREDLNKDHSAYFTDFDVDFDQYLDHDADNDSTDVPHDPDPPSSVIHNQGLLKDIQEYKDMLSRLPVEERTGLDNIDKLTFWLMNGKPFNQLLIEPQQPVLDSGGGTSATWPDVDLQPASQDQDTTDDQQPLDQPLHSQLLNASFANEELPNDDELLLGHREKPPTRDGPSNDHQPFVRPEANGVGIGRRTTAARPSSPSIESTAAGAEQFLVDECQPHILSDPPYQSPPHLADVNVKALNMMLYSFERIFNGSLTFDYLLDDTIPSIRKEFTEAMAGVANPNETVSAGPLKYLNENGQILYELRGSCLPELSYIGLGEGLEGYADEEKLQRVNQRLVRAVPFPGGGETIRLLALCHDLATLTGEMLRQEPDIPDPSVLLGTMEVYDRQKQRLADMYAEGARPSLRVHSSLPTSTSQSGKERNRAHSAWMNEVTSEEHRLPRMRRASQNSQDPNRDLPLVALPRLRDHIPSATQRHDSLQRQAPPPAQPTAHSRVSSGQQGSTSPNLPMVPAFSVEDATRANIYGYIKCLLDHSLTYDDMLDHLIPQTHALFSMSKQRSIRSPREVERGLKALDCCRLLLEKLRGERYLYQSSPKSIPLQAVLKESRGYLRTGWLEKFKRMESWFRSRVAMWTTQTDYTLMYLRRDLVAIFARVLQYDLPRIEQSSGSGKTLEHVVDTYMLELTRTFTFHSYLGGFVDRCDPEQHAVYDPRTARKLFPIVRPTASQCHTAALEELVKTPWLTRPR